MIALAAFVGFFPSVCSQMFLKITQGAIERLFPIALCGYPLVKIPVEKICSFAPILLRFDYFRQNIWRLFFAQFHF